MSIEKSPCLAENFFIAVFSFMHRYRFSPLQGRWASVFLGYHYLGRLGWVDSILNASMILGGMGPVNILDGDDGKLFSSAYALFSGLFFIGIAALLVAPFAHRLLHQLHMDEEN